MSTVHDVLQGNTSLLQQTDAAILTTSDSSNSYGYPFLTVYPFNSANSSFTQQPTFQTGNSGPPGRSYSPMSVPNAAASGRMFNNGNDVVVALGVKDCGGTDTNWGFNYYNPVTGSFQQYCLNSVLQSNANTVFTKVVMGNFKGNNLAVPLLFVQSNFGSSILSQMNFINPGTDVDDLGGANLFGDGDQTQPYSEDRGPDNYAIGSTLIAGDFNDDGVDEIAVMDSDYQTVRLFNVTLPALTIAQYATVMLPQPLTQGTLAAGRWDSSGKVYLAAIGPTAGNKKQITVNFIDPRNSTPTIVATSYNVDGLNSNSFATVFAQAAPIVNFANSTVQQLVLGLSYEYNSWHTIQIGTFDTARTFHVQGEEQQNGCLFGMQVGNYNNQTSPGNTFPGSVNPNLQILEFQNERSSSQCAPPYADNFLHLVASNITVPPDIQSNPQSTTPPSPTNWFTQTTDQIPNIGGYASLQNIALLTGDFQGRSLRLGAPEKMTLSNHIEPNLVLGMPPLHVDWIQPFTLTSSACQPDNPTPGTAQCVINLTAKPNGTSSDQTPGFTNSFSGVQGTSSNSTSKSTTSWGLAAKVTVAATVSYGQAKVAQVNAGYSLSVGNSYQNVHTQYDQNYMGMQQDLSVATGFDDVVFFTKETQNIFNYPILGQKDENGNPLYATYSVPSQITVGNGSGATQEWYQPVHEPGNVLSYPSSQAMLANEYAPGSIDVKAGGGCTALGDDSVSTKVAWNNRTGSTTTTGSTDTFSSNLNLSVSGSVTPSVLTDGVGAKFSASVDVSGSAAWGRLNEKSTVSTSSNALQVTQPQLENTSTFGYAYSNLVFGYANTNPPYQPASDVLSPTNLNVITTGPIVAGFVANPLNQDPGLNCDQAGTNWWTGVYKVPDVGFNHPLRWHVQKDNLATFNAALPASQSPLIDQHFYQMKGLYITSGANPSGATGPTIGSATTGDVVTITARVYNFSTVSTNASYPGSSVHVRIYGQPKCTTDVCPNQAFLIPSNGPDGDVVIPSIPGFNQSNPNWALASVTFDTSNYSSQQLIFWAVTWIEDATRNVLSEMPDHGVTETSFAGRNFSNISDIGVQGHSNNVGMYGTYSPFFVYPAGGAQVFASGVGAKATGASLLAVGAKPLATGAQLSAIHLALPAQTIALDEESKLQLTFTTAANDFPGSSIRYYDGDPGSGGKLIDFQRLPPLSATGTDYERIFYRPQRCGAHTLYAVSDLEGLPEVFGQVSTEVKINPLQKIGQMLGFLYALQIQPAAQDLLTSSLKSAQRNFLFGSTQAGFAGLQSFQALVHQVVSQNAAALANQQNTLLIDADQIQSCPNDLDLPQRVSPTIQFTAAPTTSTVGQNVTLTAVVTAPQGSANAPTGSVQFTGGVSSNNLTLGSATLSAQGTATIVTNQLPMGSNAIAAAYSGDATYSSVVQTATVLVNAVGTPVGDFLLATTMTSGIVSGQGSITVPVSITPQAGFSSPIRFACSGLPQDAICSFSQNPVTPSGASAAMTVTITSGVANQTAANRSIRNGGLAMACLGLLGFGALRACNRQMKALASLMVLTLVSTLLISCADSGLRSPSGVYRVTITGTSGTIAHTVDLALEIK